MPSKPKLNDLQLVLLSHCAKTDAGNLFPLPTSVDAEAASGEAKTLSRRGFLAEVETTSPAVTWHSDDNIHFGLIITEAGIERVDCDRDQLRVQIEPATFAQDGRGDDAFFRKAQEIDPGARIVGGYLTLAIDARPMRRGNTIGAKVHLLDDPAKRQVLADLVRTSHRKLAKLNMSPLKPEQHCRTGVPVNEWTKRRLPIGMLAPDIQNALLQGTAPADLDPDLLLSPDMPLEWAERRRFLGMASA